MDAVLRQEPCGITWLIIYMMANPDLEVRFLQQRKNMLKEIKSSSC